eukprot:6112988-Amphidinium_carterae.2
MEQETTSYTSNPRNQQTTIPTSRPTVTATGRMHYNKKVEYWHSITICGSYNCDEFKDTANDSTVIS